MQSDSVGERVGMNKRYWDAIAARDWPKKADLRKQIRDGASYLEQAEPKMSAYLRDIRGKKVIVLQFGDALVLLACAKIGALVTGVDLSGEQIRLAREAATYCGVDVKLVEADCQRLPRSIPNSYFDFAVAEDGIFVWIENLDAWMGNAYRVLRKGGKLVVSDHHPLSRCVEEEGGRVTFRRSYLDQSPEVYQPEKNIPPASEFTWKISDIINAAIAAGFRIDHMEEWYADLEAEGTPLIPKYFLLVATKE